MLTDRQAAAGGAWRSALEVLRWEWRLLRAHPKHALACVGLLFVPAVYAWIYLYAMWDPASHTRDLPAGLVSLDTGAHYRDRELNLGHQVLDQIERQGQFAYRRYDDPEQARREVRQGRLSFVLEIPADFSHRALPGEQPGAAKLRIYTSEGNNFASAEFARRFAPEVAQRVNTMLAETSKLFFDDRICQLTNSFDIDGHDIPRLQEKRWRLSKPDAMRCSRQDHCSGCQNIAGAEEFD